MAFHLYRSNRTEKLVDALASVVSLALDDPFAADCIVVQGKGMERWLAMQLASRLGVWANPSFPFPRKLIGDAMERVLGAADARAEAFEPEALLWSVARLLPELCTQRAFAPLRHYLEDDERGVKRLQLASRIATVFDHYVVYRPDLIQRWQRGAEEDDWQAILWRRLLDLHGEHHFAARAGRLFEALRAGAALAPPFPTRVALFGLSTLPPLYVDLLHALSGSVDVHLFLLSPSREYWGTIRDRATALREALRRDGHLPSEAELQEIEGHPLLASLGRLGREFQEVLESAADYVETDDDLYESPPAATMLAALQADILHLAQRGGAGAPGLAVGADDTSIRIHSCHSPMREIEVLHDQLLALFDANPTLEPRDVIVMTPAIDAYAPYIDAVFRPGDDLRGRIPYRIADRSARATDEVSDAFFRLLDVLGGRLGASEVLDLLAVDAVRIRARLGADDLDLVRDWIAGSGIRWGADAADREELGQPPLAENTWRFGLDRLLLGYALAGDGRGLPYGVLPYDDVEGSETSALGRLAELARILFDYRARLRAPRPLAAWRDDLTALLDAFIANTNLNAFQHQRLREALAALASRAESAGFADPVNLEVVREQLEDEIRTGTSSRGFLSGGVTFCELVPMRTIPFRVVCLVGMNDGAFPRQRRPLGFDRIAAEPRAGDRSVREDDRYLFLEALLSARETLLITYVGQSITDNSELPPSVVVSELLDSLERSFTASGGAPVRSRMVVRHPLQPFSPRNFGEAALFSYSRAHFDGAHALEAAARAELPASPPFIAAPLPAPEAAPHQITLEQLVRFFEHPTRAFLQSRLGVYLGRDLQVLEDREPLRLGGLEAWEIGDSLLRLCENEAQVAAAMARERARGALPPGELGIATFDEIARTAGEALRIARPLREGTRGSVEVDLLVGDTRITGVLRNLWPAGQLRLQYSRLGKRHELGFWLRHLLLHLAAPDGVARYSYLLGRPEKGNEKAGPALRFRTVADAEPLLRRFVELFWLGQRWPLPLFEGASRAYATQLLRARSEPEAKARSAAIKAFTAGDTSFGEDNADPHVCQIYGPDVSFEEMLRFQAHQGVAPGFEELARAIYLPLLDHREPWT